MTHPNLTRRQTELLSILLDHIAQGTVPLSRRQLAEEMGCSYSTLHGFLIGLRRRGLISWSERVPRGISVNLVELPGRFGFLAEVADIIHKGQFDRSPVARKIAEALRLHLLTEKEIAA